MKLFLKLLLLLGFSIGCGDSPFLKKGDKQQSSNSGQTENQRLFSSLQIGASLSWRLGPRVFEESQAVFLFKNVDGNLVSYPIQVEAYLWMPDMSHGADPIKIEELSPGVFQFTEIYFSMPGLWEIKVKVTSNGSSEEAIWSYTL